MTQAAYPGGYGTYSWTLDVVGNRLTQTAPGGTTNYTYDANNRLTQAGSATYSYDNNGNLTSISTGRTFTWDIFNRMLSTTASGSTVTYTYNGDGLKTRRVGPNGTTNYYHDGFRHIWETNSAGAMTAQYDRDIFGNLLSRLEPGNVRRYYHHDGIGSTTALTGTTGSVSATMLYDAWGKVRTSSGTSQGNYRFAGTELDTTTGLYHMGARFYDPTIGRWLSEDPLQDRYFQPGTLNFYAYGLGNPLTLSDPTGLLPDESSGPWSLYSPADELKELKERFGVTTLEALLAKINEAVSTILDWAKKHEGTLNMLGIVASVVGGFDALLALGAPALALVAMTAGGVAFLTTLLTVGEGLRSGRMSGWGAALSVLASAAGLVTPAGLTAVRGLIFSSRFDSSVYGAIRGFVQATTLSTASFAIQNHSTKKR